MEHSELLLSLLHKRGFTDDGAIDAFLSPDYVRDTHDPMLLFGMDRAVARVLLAIESGERIAVYADFDCDGIPGAALLSDFFAKIGYENVEVYIPHRDLEGYGFHTDAISQLSERGVSLIITVDVGTTAADAAHFAKGKGIDVIVTDHHEIMGTLPEAVAVLNPKIKPYPFRDLCGAAVAFKLVQATLREGKKRGIERFLKIADGWEKWLLDLVAIATTADMVPLHGENRALVFWGLSVLRKSPRLGINSLCLRLRVRKAELTEEDIGFSIAPRINAASRMDEPGLALRLLTTRDPKEAELLAAHLEELNASRKGSVASVVREAKRHVKSRFTGEDIVVVLGNPEWKPALLGLAANSIMQERGGVVCLWGRDGKGKLKGSCRSDGDVSLVDLFSNAVDAFEEFGGHERSGGFSVSYDRVHTLHDALRTSCLSLVREKAQEIGSSHDATLTLSQISHALHKEVSRLAPFGIGNPKPIFYVSGARITDVRRFGKEKNHVEVSLEDRVSGARARAFDFFKSPEDFSIVAAPGTEANFLATVERDTYRGGLCLRLVDIVSAS